jgi:hypothetical protein
MAMTSGGGAATTAASGSVVTLTASVTSGTAALTIGQVTFCDAPAAYCTDIHLLGTAQWTSAGTAVLSYKAVFLGTKSNAPSSSSSAALTATGTPSTHSSATTFAKSGRWCQYALTATVTGRDKHPPDRDRLLSGHQQWKWSVSDRIARSELRMQMQRDLWVASKKKRVKVARLVDKAA